MPLLGATNVRVYAKTPGASPAAFTAADLVPLGVVQEVSAEVSGESLTFNTFATLATYRIPTGKDFSLTLRLVYDPADTAKTKFLNAFNSASQTLDVLLVIGDTPATGAKNLCIYGRMIVESVSPVVEARGIIATNVSLRLADGATLTIAENVTSFPSV